ALTARLRESAGLLVGSLYGIAVLSAIVGSWLASRPDAWGHNLWDGLLAVSLAGAVALRSRVFSRIVFMLPLRLAAAAIVFATVAELAADHARLSIWLAAAIAVVGLAGVGLSVLPLSDITRARVKRSLNVVEFVVVVDLVVVTMGAVTLYDWLG